MAPRRTLGLLLAAAIIGSVGAQVTGELLARCVPRPLPSNAPPAQTAPSARPASLQVALDASGAADNVDALLDTTTIAPTTGFNRGAGGRYGVGWVGVPQAGARASAA